MVFFIILATFAIGKNLSCSRSMGFDRSLPSPPESSILSPPKLFSPAGKRNGLYCLYNHLEKFTITIRLNKELSVRGQKRGTEILIRIVGSHFSHDSKVCINLNPQKSTGMFDRKENTNEDPINVQQTRRRLADGRVLPGTVCKRSAGGVASHAILMPSRNGGINYTFKFHLLTK